MNDDRDKRTGLVKAITSIDDGFKNLGEGKYNIENEDLSKS
jgi:hypothetical protein